MVPDTAIFRSSERAIIQPNFHLRKMVLGSGTKTKRKGKENEKLEKEETEEKTVGRNRRGRGAIDETKEIESITQ